MKQMFLVLVATLLFGLVDNTIASSFVKKNAGDSRNRFTYHVNGKIVEQPPARRASASMDTEALYRSMKSNFDVTKWQSGTGRIRGMDEGLSRMTPSRNAAISGVDMSGGQSKINADFDDAGDWVRLNPQPVGDDINVIQALDSNHIRAIAGVGTYLRSDDGGDHWDVYYQMGGLSEEERIFGMAFSDSLNGYICTKDKMLRTEDGGDTWALLPSFTPGIDNYSNGWPCDIVCLSQTDIVVWWNCNYYRSTDGGNTWTGSNLGNYPGSMGGRPKIWPAESTILSHMASQIIDSTTYVVAPYESGVWMTTDAGATWQMILDTLALSVHFYDRNNGVVAHVLNTDGGTGTLFVTTDGGLSWTTRELPPGQRNYYMTFMPSPGTILASGINWQGPISNLIYPPVSQRTSIFKSTDGGVTWSNFSWLGGRPIMLVASQSQGKIFLAGTQGVIYESNPDGETWNKLTAGALIQNRDGAASPDGTRLMSVGNAMGFALTPGWGHLGLVSISTDGGVSWSEADSITDRPLLSCTFIDNSTAFAAGEGTIFKTTDGGTSWVQVASLSISAFYAIDFMDSDTGVVVGRDGVHFWRTTDGGTTWAALSLGDYNGYDVQHHGKIFLIAGDSYNSPGHKSHAEILRSSDGGNTWSNVLSVRDSIGEGYEDPRFSSVVFADSNTAYAFGGIYLAHQYNFKSTDAGVTWSRISEIPLTSGGYNAYPLKSSAVDKNTVVVATFLGTPIRLWLTSDGGISWQDLNVPLDLASDWNGVPICKPIPEGGAEEGSKVYFMQNNGPILCLPVGPFSGKNWTGVIDSSWFNPANWSPAGVPGLGDSVTIMSAPNPCVLDRNQFLVAIASLSVNWGASLTVTDSVSRFVVAANVYIGGTMVIPPNGTTQIIVGGSWVDSSNGLMALHNSSPASSTSGFSPGNSFVKFGGNAQVKGKFYSVSMEEGSAMTSQGKISVAHSIHLLDDFNLGSADTVEVTDDSPVAIQGTGVIKHGTIKRAIKPGATNPYRFESAKSYVQFDGTGTNPTAISMTTVDSLPPRLRRLKWKVVTGVRDTVANTIAASNVTGFSKWVIGTPRPNSLNVGDPRVGPAYTLKSYGSSDFSTKLSLRYDGVINHALEDSLVLLRGPIVERIVLSGWNMVSLPVIPHDARKDTLFPSATTNAFAYIGAYAPQTELQNGMGYWMKFAAPETLDVLGDEIEWEVIPVTPGWNLIGSVSFDIDAASIASNPPNIIRSLFYGYNGGYFAADTIEAMHAYWVKVDSAGALILDANAAVAKSKNASPGNSMSRYNTIIIRDGGGNEQKLYFGATADMDTTMFELPPLPPQGVFDARFATSRLVEFADPKETRYVPVQLINPQYPISVSWDIKQGTSFARLKIGKKDIALDKNGSVMIDQPASLGLDIASSLVNALPTAYALEQNYPNPFNPTTTLKYELPFDSRVSLKVFNLMGQLVSRLVDDEQQAGFRSVTWNASNYASGVYIYRFEATSTADPGRSFMQVKKMVLVK
jgi:photosystem II stability/assembly factor-like uncharacterized protein